MMLDDPPRPNGTDGARLGRTAEALCAAFGCVATERASWGRWLRLTDRRPGHPAFVLRAMPQGLGMDTQCWDIGAGAACWPTGGVGGAGVDAARPDAGYAGALAADPIGGTGGRGDRTGQRDDRYTVPGLVFSNYEGPSRSDIANAIRNGYPGYIVSPTGITKYEPTWGLQIILMSWEWNAPLRDGSSN